MAWEIQHTNEILGTSSGSGSYATADQAFDSAFDQAAIFIKQTVQGQFAGTDENPPTDARHKVWIENRAGRTRAVILRYDFFDGEGFTTNEIAWSVFEL